MVNSRRQRRVARQFEWFANALAYKIKITEEQKSSWNTQIPIRYEMCYSNSSWIAKKIGLGRLRSKRLKSLITKSGIKLENVPPRPSFPCLRKWTKPLTNQNRGNYCSLRNSRPWRVLFSYMGSWNLGTLLFAWRDWTWIRKDTLRFLRIRSFAFTFAFSQGFGHVVSPAVLWYKSFVKNRTRSQLNDPHLILSLKICACISLTFLNSCTLAELGAEGWVVERELAKYHENAELVDIGDSKDNFLSWFTLIKKCWRNMRDCRRSITIIIRK